MNSIEVFIGDESFEFTPTFLFIKKLRGLAGNGSLFRVMEQASLMDVEVMAQILLAALQSHNVRKYNVDQVGEALLSGDVTGKRGEEELKGFEVCVALLTDVISQLTDNKKEESKN